MKSPVQNTFSKVCKLLLFLYATAPALVYSPCFTRPGLPALGYPPSFTRPLLLALFYPPWFTRPFVRQIMHPYPDLFLITLFCFEDDIEDSADDENQTKDSSEVSSSLLLWKLASSSNKVS